MISGPLVQQIAHQSNKTHVASFINSPRHTHKHKYLHQYQCVPALWLFIRDSCLIENSNMILRSFPSTRQLVGNCIKRPLGFPHLKCVFPKCASIVPVQKCVSCKLLENLIKYSRVVIAGGSVRNKINKNALFRKS